MGLATHLGPWLLGTVKTTSGTTAGLIRNVGATLVCQTKTVSQTDSGTITAMSLPAGSMITNVQFITPTTAFTNGSPGTITINVGSTVLVNAQSLPTALGVAAVTIATTGGAVANNVGSTDQLITYSLSSPAGTGAASTLVITYAVRNADGTTAPSSTTGP
jgi:hypothetical protein